MIKRFKVTEGAPYHLLNSDWNVVTLQYGYETHPLKMAPFILILP